MKRQKFQKNTGFTIIETLVAIFILLLALTGPMVFSQNGLRAAFLSRDQVTAFFLAQDAIEFIKNKRDSNILNGYDWMFGLDDCLDSGGCAIDTTIALGDINLCSSGGCELADPLKYDSNNYEFGGSSGDDSSFSRKIQINDLINPDIEAEVIVTIEYLSYPLLGSRTIVVKENIFNWAGGAFETTP